MGVVQAIEAAYPKTRGGLAAKIAEVAFRVGADPYDLANLIYWESGTTFDPRVQSGKGLTSFIPDADGGPAVGLIQFTRSTADRLGTNRRALYGMSAIQQMDYVEKYLKTVSKGEWPVYHQPIRRTVTASPGPLSTTQALFMSVFYPLYKWVPPSTPFPANVQQANRGVGSPADYMRKAMRVAKLPGSTIDEYGNLRPLVPLWLVVAAGMGATAIVLGGTVAALEAQKRWFGST